VLGAISQYLGSAFAVLLFASVPAAGVAWLRVLAAAGALAAWRKPWRTRWTASRLRLVRSHGA
jgi:inner membrane transporter RhtA